MLRIVITAALLSTSWSAAANPFNDFARYERNAHAREITRCDTLAAHPDDPEAVAPGIPEGAVDVEAAITACREAVIADPANPRLNYQLARAFGYAGRHAEGAAYREQALKSGYPQSLFVVGYIRLTGWDGAPADPCYGGELIRRSAEAGRYAGLVGFVHYALLGNFAQCEDYPQLRHDEMLRFLERAEAAAGGDFYRSALITQLRHQLQR
jgi:tetratricopeptide (TPR) repeat protein